MQAAERNIEERLEGQRAEFRRRRQDAITEELLDIVTGFEASR
jgi:F-type H+-transporting ATPase subunit gamma